MKVNDVYRWSYIDPPKIDPYWCKSQIIIVSKNNNDEFLLEDTYWSGGSSTRIFKEHEVGKTIEMQFLGNLDDYEKISKYHTRYYNPKDILDLSHKNSMGDLIYLKKGAQKDLQIMEKELQYQITKCEDEIRYKTSLLKDLQEKLSTLSVDTRI